ncbi:MAG: Demethylmenaquinone methyltransferase [Candidatus Kaiserbacteria bacterium GW2011_GWA2_49_19]|uniref:Demethylmenaquinone methyltransferase n=1 Tax=Candidatus Kaiserbacteria bacterium GW2011_GWA2_49_19 TaxID=1618669 RepID=A0A0G1VS21_9BACT|nr:MAG: Demethylmenaquinone methyltransferase [Candidatus Kaiserbacteria bacterium GW2011_GWA2_49_19]
MSKRKPKYLSSEEGYNLVAGRYDEKEGYLNSFEQKKLLPLLGNIRGKKILDAGAGTGRLAVELAKFPGAKVTALDVSAEMLDRLKKKNQNIECVVGDAENLPFMSGSFDVVLAAFLMVHLKDPRRFFDEAYRVLKDGGIFLATNINQKDPPVVKTSQGSIIIESFYHRPEKIRALLESLAFSVEQEIFVKEKDVWVNQIVLARK